MLTLHRFLPLLVACTACIWAQTPDATTESRSDVPGAPGSPPSPQPPSAETVEMEKFQVSATQEAFYNSIDRKVYNVGKDISSTTGSASDLLQNIPSIQVDVEGEVSLRGDQNVTILINGKPSAQMSRNQAEALEQLSADRIERIEVITNPSAKYKPDGTGGIINIVLRRGDAAGYSATLRGNVGNEGRFNTSLAANYGFENLNLFGNLGYRRDSRPRSADQERLQRDDQGNLVTSLTQRTVENSRRRSMNAEVGLGYVRNEQTEFGASVDFGTRELSAGSTRSNLSRDASETPIADYDRIGRSSETDEDLEMNLTFDHAFAEANRTLSLELSYESDQEDGEDHFMDAYRVPLRDPILERTQRSEGETQTEFTTDYVHPFADGSKLESGYALEAEETDVDTNRSFFNRATETWLLDPATSNHFIYKTAIHALYATYARPIGSFGFLAGLRFEQTNTEGDQVTTGIRAKNDYARFYPSLHLTYDLTDVHQLNLSYSHRVSRPDGDDLNPFPQYDDPLNLRVGNPDLKPEDIHSIEAGYQYRHDDVTYLVSLYQRYRYNGITDVTRLVDGDTLLTTRENLSTSRASGLELGATTRLRERLSLNFSANIYRNEIDARALGFAETRATTAWEAKLNAAWTATKALTLQLTTGYTAKRLTPQGERYPTYVTNLGARYGLKNGKTSLVLTVTDVFNSLKNRTVIDTPTLRNDVTRRRSPRIIYIGFIHQFGKSSKSDKGELQLDDGEEGS